MFALRTPQHITLLVVHISKLALLTIWQNLSVYITNDTS